MGEPSSSSSSPLPPLFTLILLISLLPLLGTAQFLTDDSTALFAFKSALASRTHSLDNWTSTSYPCTAWNGVYCNSTFTGPRVFQLRLPGTGLSGAIPPSSISKLSSLRILSLRHNSIASPLPDDLSAQRNITQLILNNNKFTGPVPAVLSSLTSLQRLDLSSNNFSGEVPVSLRNLTQLDTLYLHNNSFSGTLPQDLNFTHLVQFNISFNSELSGPIPQSLRKFPASAFIGTKLCGGPLGPCAGPTPSPPAPSPSGPASSSPGSGKKLSTGAIVGIGFASVFAVLVLMFFLAILFKKGQNDNQRAAQKEPPVVNQTGGQMAMNGEQGPQSSVAPPVAQAGISSQAEPHSSSTTTQADQPYSAATTQPKPYSTATAFSNAVPTVTPVPEAGQDRRRLVFFRKGQVPRFDLEQLLRASAEVLGKGTFGTTYKAVLESGETVAVKRVQKVYLPDKEFRDRIARVGELEHTNIVPLIAYYHSKDETLLTYDFMPMGSLSAVLHGNRGSGIPPLNWETRTNIALAISRGLQYIHAAGPTFSHGNVKSSNVLLTTSYEARLSDHGLFSFATSDSSSTSRIVGYRAPEIVDSKKISQKADIYSFGVLLLELLTGKAPGRAIMSDDGVDLPRWVQSVLDEDFSGDVFDMDLVRYQSAGEDMMQLLQLGIDCTKLPDQRPNVADVVARIEEIVKNREVSASGESGAE